MPPLAEELPIEEVDGISQAPDWNAIAWARIQARDAKALPASQLGSHLAALTFDSLTSMQAVLTREPQDVALMDAIEAEIARRPASGEPERP